MNPTDKPAFVEGLNACLALYRQPEAPEAVVRLWWEALKRFPIGDVAAGFNRHVQDPDQGQFPPKPADIIRNIDGNTQTQGEQAWTKVDRAVRTVGPYQSVVFDDWIIHRVIDDMGGWIKLCQSSEGDYRFLHKEFITRYRGYVNRPPASVPKKLIGHTEHDYLMNRGQYKRGMGKLPRPVVIGDVERAREVYRIGTDTKRVAVSFGDLVPPVRKLETKRLKSA